MHIELPPDAPLVLKAGAAALLATHIGGGSLAIASGFVTSFARKGGVLHRGAGTVFFASMLAMAGVGASVSPFLPAEQLTNTTAAVFTLYLAASGWTTVKRRPGKVGAFERWAVLVPLSIASLGLITLVPGLKPHEPTAGVIYPFALVASLAAACDLIILRGGGIAGPARLRRHLWRMFTALFVASGSFFLGQQGTMPEAWRGLPIWFVPALAPLALMIFWLVRTRGPRRRKPMPAPA